MNNISLELGFWDTNGAENYPSLRPLSYPGAHVVLICFSAGSTQEREEVRRTYAPEVRHHCRGVPTVLVGFEPAAGDSPDADRTLVSQQGLDLAKEIGSIAYVQCNTETGAGANDALEAVSSFSLFHRVGHTIDD